MKPDPISDYWLKYYCTDHCTLCGNHGVVDTWGVLTPVGKAVGRVNWCICPNGQAMREHANGAAPDQGPRNNRTRSH